MIPNFENMSLCSQLKAKMEKDDTTNPESPGSIRVDENGAIYIYDYTNYRLPQDLEIPKSRDRNTPK